MAVLIVAGVAVVTVAVSFAVEFISIRLVEKAAEDYKNQVNVEVESEAEPQGTSLEDLNTGIVLVQWCIVLFNYRILFEWELNVENIFPAPSTKLNPMHILWSNQSPHQAVSRITRDHLVRGTH